mmetsp:Transcript_117560/g.329151  ORF Transcript_117560/g.329151 Transcript_117560/m.329151 type:complete len:328 (-) Transcript_117560:214-1197(-)
MSSSNSSRLAISAGSTLCARMLSSSTTRVERPTIAKTYVVRKMTTHVQNKVLLESTRPRINIHASWKSGVRWKIRTRRASRMVRNTAKVFSGPAAWSNPKIREKSGMSQEKRRPVTSTRTMSAKLAQDRPVGLKALQPNTWSFSMSSTRNAATKMCSRISVTYMARSLNCLVTSWCAQTPTVAQFARMIRDITVSKANDLTRTCMHGRRCPLAFVNGGNRRKVQALDQLNLVVTRNWGSSSSSSSSSCSSLDRSSPLAKTPAASMTSTVSALCCRSARSFEGRGATCRATSEGAAETSSGAPAAAQAPRRPAFSTTRRSKTPSICCS